MTLKLGMRIDLDAAEAERGLDRVQTKIGTLGKGGPAPAAAAGIREVGAAAGTAAKEAQDLAQAQGQAGTASAQMGRQLQAAANDAGAMARMMGAAGRDAQVFGAGARQGAAAASAFARDAAEAAAAARDLSTAMRQAARDAAVMERQAANSNVAIGAMTGSLGGLRGMLAALGIGITVQQLTQMADGWTIVGNRVRLVAANDNQVDRLRLAIFGLAQDTRSANSATADLFAGISRSAAQLKVSEGQVLAVTRAINQGFRISGGSQASADAAVTQLLQGLASGVLRGEEFNSVMEQAPRLAQAMADALGKTRGELRAMAEQGQLTAETVIKALLSQAEAIDTEFSRVQVTIGEGWTVLINGAQRWVGEAATATGAAALLANIMVGLGANFGAVGALVAGLATVGLVRLALGLRTATTETLRKRAAQAAEAQAEVAATAAVQQKTAADLVAARAELQRLAAIGATGRALAAEAAAQQAATAATDKHTAALERNRSARGATGVGGLAKSAVGGALAFAGGWPGLVATAAVVGVTYLTSAQTAGERSAESYSKAMELAARSIGYVPEAAKAASGAVNQLRTDMVNSTQAAARQSAQDAEASIRDIRSKIQVATLPAMAGNSTWDQMFKGAADRGPLAALAAEVQRDVPRTSTQVDALIGRLNLLRAAAENAGDLAEVARIDAFSGKLRDLNGNLTEEENRLHNANRALAETERRQRAAEAAAQSLTQAWREQRDMMARATGTEDNATRRAVLAAAPQLGQARGAASALDGGGLAGLARYRAEQKQTAEATQQSEKIFKAYQEAQGVTGEKAVSLADALKGQNAELRLAAQVAQDAGRATAQLNVETERRERLAQLDQDNRDLQAALVAWRALPPGVRDYARAVEQATISTRAAAVAREMGQGDDPAAIEAITAQLRQRLDLERSIKEEQDQQALAARIRETSTGGMSAANRELELSVKLLAEGRISQEQFSAQARAISVDGFEAYRRAVKDGNTELAAAVKAQIEAQAKIAWGAIQAKAALDGVIARALDAMISLTQAGSQAGGILGWVAGLANGVLTRAREGQGEPTEVPTWESYWQGLQGQWADWNKGHGSKSGRDKKTDFERETKRVRDQIRDMKIQADSLGLSTEAAARLTAQRRLLTAAETDGRAITSQLTAEIDKQADAYGRAAEAQRLAQVAQRQRETLAGGAISLVGSTARPAEARRRELTDLGRMTDLIQAGDPTTMEKLSEAGFTAAEALEAIRRRTLELDNPGVTGFLDGFKTSFRDLFSTIIKGSGDADDALGSFLASLGDVALDKFVMEPLGEYADGVFDRFARGAGLGAKRPANDNGAAGGGILQTLFGGILGGDSAASAAISVGTATITVASGLGGLGGGIPDRPDAIEDLARGLVGGKGQDKVTGGAAGDALAAGVDQIGGALQGVAQGVQDKGQGFLGRFGNALGDILGGIGDFFSGIFGGGGGGGAGFLASIGGWLGFAQGAAFSAGHVQRFASGGVVGSTTLFPMAGGRTGMMGEAGPEAIMPLMTGAGGLAVRAANANGQIVPLQLARLADGSLGVALPPAQRFAQGGVFGGDLPPAPPVGRMPQAGGRAGAGVSISMPVSVAVDRGSGGGAPEDTAEEAGAMAYAAVRSTVLSVLREESRYGGELAAFGGR